MKQTRGCQKMTEMRGSPTATGKGFRKVIGKVSPKAIEMEFPKKELAKQWWRQNSGQVAPPASSA